MIIHVVETGETIYSISKKYQIPVTTLINENGITNPGNLVVGQTIVIIYPDITYTVQNGDYLIGIAAKYDVSVMQLLRNNPFLADRTYLIPGETIVISYRTDKTSPISLSGYAYPFIDETVLRKTLPYLTYLNVFNYRITKDGDIVTIAEMDDTKLIQMAKSYGVAPIMFLSTLSEKGIGSSEAIYTILTNPQIQEHLIENVIDMLKRKGYYGINIYLQYIRPENQVLAEAYLIKFSQRLRSEGLRVVATVTPRMFIERTEIIYEELDYTTIAQNVDALLISSYEWGTSFGPPASVTPVNIVCEILNHVTSQVSPDQVYLGLPIINYDWQLPYIPGESKASAISNENAIELAVAKGVSIEYNEVSQAPYYFYTNLNKEIHIVWFKDARSIDAITNLIPEYGLKGMSIWNIMVFFTQMWFIIDNKFVIEKIL